MIGCHTVVEYSGGKMFFRIRISVALVSNTGGYFRGLTNALRSGGLPAPPYGGDPSPPSYYPPRPRHRGSYINGWIGDVRNDFFIKLE